MDNLLPCPFCGGETSVRLYYKGRYAVHCNRCDAHMELDNTEADAIEAWNTRVNGSETEETSDNAPLRTCEIEIHEPTGEAHCKSCGYLFDWPWWKVTLLNYCPNCGAKAVGE